MKNKLISSFSILLLTFTIAACSNSEESNSSLASGGEKESSAAASNMDEIGLYGEVSEMIGNEVELRLIEKPERSAANGEKDGNGGGRKSGASGRGGEGAGAVGGGSATKERKYTGEEKTFVIPVGVSLVTVTRGEGGMEESEISLNEVTPGSILSVYYQENGKTIEKIRVQKPRTGGGKGGRGGN
ncbi:hypothetical protein [Fictibacillus fluitans]|uniref:Lipoprotein n=1 Tax=Fictibacillus fluitans TaxID=3058422 RepID=A0ABT8HSV2_9BACL|nr:hypothetical protein [Fictibacillus sp. NE201]MDN4523352.1 hypothetical protein [Fictibacillus sp. NE201]